MAFWLVIDVIGAGMLFCAGVLALAAWHGRGRRGSTYWLLAGMGLVYLAVDERLSLHERIGRRLSEAGVPNPPGVNHMDDAVLCAFALAGALVTLVFTREVLRHRQVIGPLLIGAMLTAAGLGVDATAPVDGLAPKIEELLELGGQLCLFLAIALRWSEGRVGMPRRGGEAAAPLYEAAPAD